MEVEIKAGARFDTLSGPEFRDGLDKAMAEAEAQQEARLRAIKPIRLAPVIGKAVANVLTMAGDTGQQLVTPESGYVWSLRHLVIEGLATGATPDVVNILRGIRIIWQLNGNQFAQTWGRGEILLYAGETLTYQSVGTFTSTATIIAHGLAEGAPAERVGVFY